MNINYEVLDTMLMDLVETDIITHQAKEELKQFVVNHDRNVLSQEVCDEMFGIYKLTLRPAYEAVTGEFLPNLFVKEVM